MCAAWTLPSSIRRSPRDNTIRSHPSVRLLTIADRCCRHCTNSSLDRSLQTEEAADAVGPSKTESSGASNWPENSIATVCRGAPLERTSSANRLVACWNVDRSHILAIRRAIAKFFPRTATSTASSRLPCKRRLSTACSESSYLPNDR